MNKDRNSTSISGTDVLAACLIGSVFYGILVSIIFATYAHKQTTQQKIQNEKIEKLDHQINTTAYAIDSVYNAWSRFVADSMHRNPQYAYMVPNSPYIDSLRDENRRLLSRAYTLAQNYCMINIPPYNDKLFTDFNHVPGLPKISRKYFVNKNKIRTFDTRTKDIKNLENAIRNHCDGTVMKKIYRLQVQQDSLLNLKRNLINTRTR